MELRSQEKTSAKLCETVTTRTTIKPNFNPSNNDSTAIEKSLNRRILAEFVSEIPEDIGWWYRLSHLDMGNTHGHARKNSKFLHHPDSVMPHLGTIFGLTEEATAIICLEMGCLRLYGKKTVMHEQGWENLRSEFGMRKRVE